MKRGGQKDEVGGAHYDKVSANVMISVQKMGESESCHMVF